MRRAQAREKIDKLVAALEDYKAVLVLEPSNAVALSASIRLKFSHPPHPSKSSIAIAKGQTIPLPDIVIAANCGLHDYGNGLNASWEPTSKLLARMDVPVVYTAYTEEEGELDEQQLRQWGAKVLVSNTKNSWRGLTPVPDEFDCSEFYYYNFFFTVTKGLAK